MTSTSRSPGDENDGIRIGIVLATQFIVSPDLVAMGKRLLFHGYSRAKDLEIILDVLRRLHGGSHRQFPCLYSGLTNILCSEEENSFSHGHVATP